MSGRSTARSRRPAAGAAAAAGAARAGALEVARRRREIVVPWLEDGASGGGERGTASIADWSSCDECQTHRMASVRGAATASAAAAAAAAAVGLLLSALDAQRVLEHANGARRVDRRLAQLSADERKRIFGGAWRERRRRAQVLGRRFLGIDVARLDGAPRLHRHRAYRTAASEALLPSRAAASSASASERSAFSQPRCSA